MARKPLKCSFVGLVGGVALITTERCKHWVN